MQKNIPHIVQKILRLVFDEIAYDLQTPIAGVLTIWTKIPKISVEKQMEQQFSGKLGPSEIVDYVLR